MQNCAAINLGKIIDNMTNTKLAYRCKKKYGAVVVSRWVTGIGTKELIPIGNQSIEMIHDHEAMDLMWSESVFYVCRLLIRNDSERVHRIVQDFLFEVDAILKATEPPQVL